MRQQEQHYFPHLFPRVAREIQRGKVVENVVSFLFFLSAVPGWLRQAKPKEKRNYETQRNWKIWTGARGYSVALYESLLHPDADWARPKGRAMVERRARRTNLMGMQCGNFKLDLFPPLLFSSVLFGHPQSLPSRRLQHRRNEMASRSSETFWRTSQSNLEDCFCYVAFALQIGICNV